MDGRPGASDARDRSERILFSGDRLTLFGVARALVPVLTLVTLAASPSIRPDAGPLAALLTAQVALVSVTHAMALRRSVATAWWIWFGVLLDLGVIGALCAFTGGAGSPLAFLFTLEALGGGILLSSGLGIRVLVLSTLALAGLDAASTGGLIQAGDVRGLQAISMLWLIAGGGTLFSVFNEREVRRHAAELDTMHRVTLDIEGSLSLEEILADLCRGVVERFGFSGAAVLLREDNLLTCAGAQGITGRTGETVARRGPLAQAIQTREPVVVRGTRARADGALLDLIGPRGYVAVPLGEEGILVVTRAGRGRRSGVVHAAEIEALMGLGNHVVLALANARLHAHVSAMAITDPLTSLFNHGEFQRVLANELGRQTRFSSLRGPGHHTSLIMGDLDEFKRLNDALGHPAGDDVLREASAAIRGAVRSFDVCARYGGEEFAIVLPETDLPSALGVAERIRRAVEVRTAGSSGRAITISLGVATAPKDGRTPDALIAAADAALYASKGQGRNRVTSSAELRGRGKLVVFPGPSPRPKGSAGRRAPDAGQPVRERSSRPTRRTPRA